MRRYSITVNDEELVVDVEVVGANLFRVYLDGRLVDVELTDHRDLGHGSITPAVQVAQPVGETASRPVERPGRQTAAVPGAATASARAGSSAQRGGLDKVTAPMPGVILAVNAAVGALVKRGEPLLVLEAMKMKNELKSPRDGVVAEVYVGPGQQVAYGEFLVRFED